jgi:hypothetical protein
MGDAHRGIFPKTAPSNGAMSWIHPESMPAGAYGDTVTRGLASGLHIARRPWHTPVPTVGQVRYLEKPSSGQP